MNYVAMGSCIITFDSKEINEMFQFAPICMFHQTSSTDFIPSGRFQLQGLLEYLQHKSPGEVARYGFVILRNINRGIIGF